MALSPTETMRWGARVGILFYGVPVGTTQAVRISDGFGAALYFLVALNAAVVVLVQLLPRDRTEVAV